MSRSYGRWGRCTATSKQTEQQCRQPAVPGLEVCHYHGGGSPQARKAAARRLLEERMTGEVGDALAVLDVGADNADPLRTLLGAVAKAEALTELVGPDALRSRLDPTALQAGRIEHALRFSLGMTIYAGTSEIQRNIIAQRACWLPR